MLITKCLTRALRCGMMVLPLAIGHAQGPPVVGTPPPAASMVAPSYFAVGGASSASGKWVPFTSVGIHLIGDTYALTSLSQPLTRGEKARLLVEGCQRLTSDKHLSLWVMGGVGSSSQAQTAGGVTFGAFLSLRLPGSAFATVGVRAMASPSADGKVDVEKVVGVGWEWR